MRRHVLHHVKRSIDDQTLRQNLVARGPVTLHSAHPTSCGMLRCQRGTNLRSRQCTWQQSSTESLHAVGLDPCNTCERPSLEAKSI